MEALTAIEILCEQQLTTNHIGDDLWPGYLVARSKVFTDLLPYIRQTEPFLSDHGPAHIINVFNNALELLGKEQCTGTDSKRSLDPTELYFLVLSILFHDVGNVFSRKDHKSRLGEAYGFARGTEQTLLAERHLLFRIVGAHGGTTPQGSPDTIKPLERNGVFRGKRVDCQRVAAILRLADELAEGPHRTSLFMQRHFGYPPESRVFHDYANICNIYIGRDDSRLALVFHIDIMPELWGPNFDPQRLRDLLEFCYHRISKVELERKYNRHYCSLLTAFRQTEISFHFHCHNHDLALDLPKIVLDDLVLPHDITSEAVTKDNPLYSLDAIMDQLNSASASFSQSTAAHS